MATPFESAQLNLKLFELRREPALRAARAWFLHHFNPESLADIGFAVKSDRNADFRMVLSYWEMAASLVATGAIDRTSFLAAHGEVIATFGKVFPFLSGLRAVSGEPTFCQYLEQVLALDPDTVAVMTRRRTAILAAARAQAGVPVEGQS